MRKLVEKHGMILRGLLFALACAVPVAVMTVGTNSGQYAADEHAAVLIAEEREAAHSALFAGDIEGGAVALLDSLRALPDDVELLEPAHATLQLLAFTMVALMPDELLDRFLKHLEPADWPVDGLVLAYYAREMDNYSQLRGFGRFRASRVWEAIDALEESPSALARAGGNLMSATPSFGKIGLEEIGRIITGVNALAEALPGSRVVTEVVREHLRTCLDLDFWLPEDRQALAVALSNGAVDPAVDEVRTLDFFAAILPWNEQVRRIWETDPVVAYALDASDAVAATAGAATAAADDEQLRRDCIAMTRQSAAANADPDVRDWRLRSMVGLNGGLDSETTAEEAAAVREASALPAMTFSPDERVPLEVARAALNQLAAARVHPGEPLPVSNLKEILMLPRDAEPLEINMFESAPRRLAHYGYALVRRGDIAEAAEVFEQLASLYPGGFLCEKWGKQAAHLRRATVITATAGR